MSGIGIHSLPVDSPGLLRVSGANLNRTWIARRQKEKRSRLVFYLVRSALRLVGDTGFEPVTSSV